MAKRQHQSFNFEQLCVSFSEICADYSPNICAAKSQCLGFALKVLFELGPKMHHIKLHGTHQMWRLLLQNPSGSDSSSIYIYTYSFPRPVNVQPQVQDHKLYLTLKQAGLLAASILCDQLPAQHNPRDKILLTPLARAVFSPQSVAKIATMLTNTLGRVIDSGEVLKIIISSCQVDGYHLKYSQCHVALVAIDTTVTDVAQRQKLRSKTLRLYARVGKTYNAEQYKIYAQFSKLAGVQLQAQIESAAQQPTTPPAAALAQSTTRASPDLDSVLRSIARSVDDPISGRTVAIAPIDLQTLQETSKASEQPNPTLHWTESCLAAPTELQVNATSLGDFRDKLLTPSHNNTVRAANEFARNRERFRAAMSYRALDETWSDWISD